MYATKCSKGGRTRGGGCEGGSKCVYVYVNIYPTTAKGRTFVN